MKPSAFPEPVVIIANGEYPSHPLPLGKIEYAKTRICTDGSADRLMAQGFVPDVIVGDMDSVDLPKSEFHGVWVSSQDQKTTDMEKALNWCQKQNISKVTIVGASGQRDDHTLANYVIISEFSEAMEISMVTDGSTIRYLKPGQHTFTVNKHQSVSLLAFMPVRSITARGLKYPLREETLLPSGRGISNLAEQNHIKIHTSDPIWFFLQHSA